MRIQHDLDLDVPIEVLWSLTIAIEEWPTFTPTVTSAERLDEGPLRTGSRVRLKQPGQPPRIWTVTTLEPLRRFEWSTRLLGATMTGIHELATTGSGARNTLAVELSGWSAGLLRPLLRASIARALASENSGFKSAAESRRGRGSA